MSTAVAFSHSIESVAPFRRSPEAPTFVPAELRGTVPPWLRGELVRTCPAVFELPGWHADHWFDGLAMLYAFRVDASRSVAFRSRLMDTEASRDASTGSSRMATFGTPIVRPFWRRVIEPIPRVTDNTNVNVVALGGELVAMTESPTQLLVAPDSLSVRGAVPYDDELSGAIMSAHPHFDFQRGRVVNVATRLGASAVLSVYEHGPAERQRHVVGAWRTKDVPYVHSFGLTPKSAILVGHPFTARPVSMLWSNRGFIDHFAWQPERGTRLVVVDRATGAPREHTAEPFFCFHVVNAFDDDGACVLDLLAYPDAQVVERLRVDRMNERLPDLRPSLLRLTMTPGRERANIQKLTDVGFEFPSTNYRRFNGTAHRFVWGASNGYDSNDYASTIVKVDTRDGSSVKFGEDGTVFGEPVFVARPDGVDEDDGVLLSVGTKRASDTSALVVLDAKTLELLARAEVPYAIPLGFHGSFVRAGVGS